MHKFCHCTSNHIMWLLDCSMSMHLGWVFHILNGDFKPSLSHCWRTLGPLFFTTLLQFIEVCRHSLKHSSLKVPPQHFSQGEVSTLTGSFCCRFAEDRWPHVWLFKMVGGRLHDCKVPKFCVCKTSHKPHLFISVLGMRCLWCFPDQEALKLV